MTDHGEQIYRKFHPDEAAIGDQLIPHGWERIHANTWRKKAAGSIAKVVYTNGRTNGNGDLRLLAEAARLLAATDRETQKE